MKRYLPPLIVLALLGALLIRTLGSPSADVDQERIRATWAETASQDRGRALTRAYAKAHTREADKHFVVESWMRLGDVDAALDAMFGEATANVTPESARTFAEIALPAMGWHDRARTLARPWALAVEIALAEAGTPWMLDELRRRAASAPIEATADTLRRAARFGDRTTIDLIVKGYRSRTDLRGLPARHAQFLSAVATHGIKQAASMPEDRAFLLETVRRERLRESGGWAQCVLALGRTADPAVMQTLRREREALLRIGGDREARDAAVLNASLWAGGDGEAEKRARDWAQDAAFDAQLVDVYTEAGLHRYLLGDERARRILGRVWETFGDAAKGVRYHITFRLMFQHEPPLTGEPAEKMLRDLDVDRNPTGRVLGAAYRLRLGEPGALDQVVQALRATTRFGDSPAEATDAWIFGLRALLLYT